MKRQLFLYHTVLRVGKLGWGRLGGTSGPLGAHLWDPSQLAVGGLSRLCGGGLPGGWGGREATRLSPRRRLVVFIHVVVVAVFSR